MPRRPPGPVGRARRPRWRPALAAPAPAAAAAIQLLDDLAVDPAELLAPNGHGPGHTIHLVGLVVDNHVHPRVLVDLAEGLHVAAREQDLAEAGLVLHLCHVLALRPQEQADHVRAVHVAATIGASLGLREAHEQKADLLRRCRLALARHGRHRGVVQLVPGHDGVVVPVEDDVCHALGLPLPPQEQYLLHIRGAQSVKVLPEITLGGALRQAPDEDLEVALKAVLVLWEEAGAVRHVALIHVNLLAEIAVPHRRGVVAPGAVAPIGLVPVIRASAVVAAPWAVPGLPQDVLDGLAGPGDLLGSPGDRHRPVRIAPAVVLRDLDARAGVL
mmetsp:Transcript_55701/g.180847  ORF Transcript_55701/g.180847 Transcript_55701/m.180847 type:complete len:330 (+) Transcript_55701:1520-2509(+)